jgi:Family of unknown function (DUF6263)
MNKNLLLITTTLALSLSWVGCNKSGKLAEPSTFKTPSGPVELKLKWPPGERVVQDMDMKQNMEFAIPGQPNPMKQDMTMGQEYGLTVLKETPDGGHEVEMEFLSTRLGMKMGDKTMLDYDSTKKATTDKPNPAGDMFGKIVGSKILLFLDASNEVQRVEGVDDLMSRLSTGAQADALASLKGMYTEGYFKQMMSANRFMPTKAVQPGDTWPVQIEFPMSNMGILELDYTFTFASWEMHGKRNCARFEFQGTITTKPDPTAKPGGMSISILNGDTSGISWFDPELGKSIETIMNQDMKMVIKVPNPRAKPGTPGQMQSITNQMNQAITIKLVSVK